jgi:hypothetical protein
MLISLCGDLWTYSLILGKSSDPTLFHHYLYSVIIYFTSWIVCHFPGCERSFVLFCCAFWVLIVTVIKWEIESRLNVCNIILTNVLTLVNIMYYRGWIIVHQRGYVIFFMTSLPLFVLCFQQNMKGYCYIVFYLWIDTNCN